MSLTLRYDKLDSFWYCLSHELAHIGRHFDKEDLQSFVDDFSAASPDGRTPGNRGRRVGKRGPNPAVGVAGQPRQHQSVADERYGAWHDVGIAAAIVAGRVRYVHRNYRLLTHFVGLGEVRRKLGYTDC